jgi:hypothetical protein
LQSLKTFGPSYQTDLERRLQEGIGAVTTRIFLRELRGVWAVCNSSGIEQSEARRRESEHKPADLEGATLARLETALVKLSLRYCKKKRCTACVVKDFCRLIER